MRASTISIAVIFSALFKVLVGAWFLHYSRVSWYSEHCSFDTIVDAGEILVPNVYGCTASKNEIHYIISLVHLSMATGGHRHLWNFRATTVLLLLFA